MDNDHLVRTLSGAMRTGVYDLQAHDQLKTRADYDIITGSVTFNLPQRVSMHFRSRLAGVLGLTSGDRGITLDSGTHTTTRPLDYAGAVDALYVYSDLVQPSLVGDALVPLLRVVPIQGKRDSELCYVEYIKPTYVPLTKLAFSTIEIYITDSTGRPIPFLFGKTTVVLHIRRVRKRG